MALKVSKAVLTEQQRVKEQRSRRGKRSKAKGNQFERDVAKKFKDYYEEELVRTPQSGGFAKRSARAGDFRGDIVPVDENIDLAVHIECKNAKTWSLPAWFKQASEDCPEGKAPVVVFHQHGTSNDFIALKLEDFFKLVPKDRIVIDKRV